MTATNSPKLPLFVPGHRADIATKAAASGADMVIIDLEDAVAEPDTEAARAQLANSAPLSVPIAARINSSDSPWFATDLDAVKASPAEMVIVPKAESACALDSVRDALGPDMPILPIIETACGLDTVATLLAHPTVPLCAFGHLDFSLDIGAESDWEALHYARGRVVLASRLGNKASPLDGVSVRFDDEDIVAGEARRARDMGFGGKLLIHPRQISPAKGVFRPSDDDYAWAKRVIEAVASNASAVQLDGAMIDVPVIKRAEAIIQNYEALA